MMLGHLPAKCNLLKAPTSLRSKAFPKPQGTCLLTPTSPRHVTARPYSSSPSSSLDCGSSHKSSAPARSTYSGRSVLLPSQHPSLLARPQHPAAPPVTVGEPTQRTRTQWLLSRSATPSPRARSPISRGARSSRATLPAASVRIRLSSLEPDSRDLSFLTCVPLIPLVFLNPRANDADVDVCPFVLARRAAIKLSTDEWKGKKVVLVAVPGAFTVRPPPPSASVLNAHGRPN